MSRENLPSTWERVKLGEVSSIVMGQSPPSTTYNKEGDGLFFLQGKAEFTEVFPLANKFCNKPLKVAKESSVLISVRAPVGDVNLADRDYIIGRGLASIKLKKGDKWFLFYLLLHNKKNIESQGAGATFQSINRTVLDNFPIYLPPLPEQQAIARALRAVQEAKEARRREAALERERKATLMDYLFTHGTGSEPRKQTEIGEMPQSWRVVRLGELGEIITGTTPRTQVTEYYGGPYMFIAPGDIGAVKYVTKTQKYLSEKGLKVSRQLPCNTVLVVCIGATIGKVAMTTAEKSVTNQQINAILANKEVSPQFLYYAIDYRSHALPSLAGRAAIPIVNKSVFAGFSIPFPPSYSEQQEIAEVLSASDAKIAALEQETALLEELFRAMLEELMTGRLSALPLVEAEGTA